MTVSTSQPQCPFCARIRRGEHDHAAGDCVVFPPLEPAVPGHRLIVAREHVTDVMASPAAGKALLGDALGYARSRGITDFDLVTSACPPPAGGHVPHLHWHFLPRHDGDEPLFPWERPRP